MNKKIFLFLFVVSITVAGLSAISAAESQTVENNTVEIGGIEFTIPDNFNENTTLRIENQTRNIGSINYILDSRAYENEKDFMTIFVSNYDNFDRNHEMVNQIGGEIIYVDSEEGFLHESREFYSFTFEKDDKIVAMTSNNKDLFDDFII